MPEEDVTLATKEDLLAEVRETIDTLQEDVSKKVAESIEITPETTLVTDEPGDISFEGSGGEKQFEGVLPDKPVGSIEELAEALLQVEETVAEGIKEAILGEEEETANPRG